MNITSLDRAVAAALASLDRANLPDGLTLTGGTICPAPRIACGTGRIDYVFVADNGRAMVAITDGRGTKSWPLGGVATTPRHEMLTRLGVTEPTTTPKYEAYCANRAEGQFSAMDFYTWEMNDQPTGNW